MDREERLAMIDQLQFESAELLADIAAREARTAAGLDPPEWQAPRRAQQQKTEIIRKDFHGEQPALPQATTTMTPEQQAPWDAWFDERLCQNFEEVYFELFGVCVADQIKKQREWTGIKIREVTAAPLAELEARLDDLEQRVAALEGGGNGGYQG